MEPGPDQVILSVAELNREARELLEHGFPALWVEGEISNFIHHGSGHMYFDLKDDQAQVRCAMFRSANRRLQFRPGNGQQVLLRGRVTLYEARGSFQLVAEQLEPAGEGLLRRQLEALKARLQAEGLFAEERKRPLPRLPRLVAVVTSPSGAALRDIIKVLSHRFPAVPVRVYPATVQGDKAPRELAAAIGRAGRDGDCDVLIVGRGGGSLEDLWAFNDELVVRAIHNCPIPVVSAVGHETDVTLADFVADRRAATPSAAAEQVVPDCREWQLRMAGQQQRAARAIALLLGREREMARQLTARLRRCDPKSVLHQHAQRVDELGLRLRRAAVMTLRDRQLRLTETRTRVLAATPVYRIREQRQALATRQLLLASALRGLIATTRQRLASLAGALQAVSPLGTLERGYSLIQDEQTGKLLRDSRDMHSGQAITGRLARGSFTATVRKTSDC